MDEEPTDFWSTAGQSGLMLEQASLFGELLDLVRGRGSELGIKDPCDAVDGVAENEIKIEPVRLGGSPPHGEHA